MTVEHVLALWPKGMTPPEGFLLRPYGRHSLLVISPTGLMATVDLEERGFRSGGTVTGKLTSTEKYIGRGWREGLFRDAVRWLRIVEIADQRRRKG